MFSFESHRVIWQQSIVNKIVKAQGVIAEEMRARPTFPEKELVALSHRQTVQEFFRQLSGPQNFISHSACFCCLQNMPEHPLPCGHVLCTRCVRTYSEIDHGQLGPGRHFNTVSNFEQKPWAHDVHAKKYFIELDRCPLHRDWRFVQPWYIKLKPEFSGTRILTLDGYETNDTTWLA